MTIASVFHQTTWLVHFGAFFGSKFAEEFCEQRHSWDQVQY